ncbi:SCO family protein [Candidatus Aminicenantes bacterium AH-873-B07]|jgi:protein SCO1/2|nr:SCO family protein [Candidatus Aminicenantes bacterium AH-873-B07]
MKPKIIILSLIILLLIGGVSYKFFKKKNLVNHEQFSHPAVQHPEVAGKRVVQRIALIEPKPAYNFKLLNYTKDTISLSDFKGKVVVIGFIYTHCPDVCGILTMHYVQLQRIFKKEIGKSLELIFITTDPERDVPERVAAYTRGFKGKWYFLTGKREELEKVWESYYVFVKDNPRAGIVYHTYMIALIDREGFIRYRYIGLVDPTNIIATDIKNLLKEKHEIQIS